MIVLVGFMGSGKSTVGRLLALELGLPFVDTDAVVETRAGRSIAEIFAAEGEGAFRELERKVVAEVLDGPEAVVALGGGALGDPATCTAREWATVVHLDVGFGEILRRVGADGTRPMLARDPKALYHERAEIYRRVADHRVSTEGSTPEVVVAQVAALVGAGPGRPADARRVMVALGERGYEVLIGHGLATRAGELMPELSDAERAFVVTHPSLQGYVQDLVAALSARGLTVEVVTVPEGERSKSLAVAADLYARLADAGAHRHDVVVTFGGGVVGDLAGYVASTFNRGLALVHVPTSLLAQVDAAIGGKTAVNLPHGKNLVGTIHQPVVVLCDVSYLDTLPDAELRSGMAEVIKYGFISDPSLLDLVERGWPDILGRDRDVLVDVVQRSAAVKAGIVMIDEREHGERAFLNYGHTFAHAIEKVHEMEGIRHGEAVALGMIAAAHLAAELGLIDADLVARHRKVLATVGLPTSARFDFESLRAAWRHDKKYRHGTRFVLLAGLGRPRAGVEAPTDVLRRAIERLGAG